MSMVSLVRRPRAVGLLVGAGAAAFIALAGSGASAATILGPSPYVETADSPFAGVAVVPGGYFYLEDFEDGALDVPGVSASTGSPLSPNFLTDSVDGDDGVIDGSGTDGFSYYVATNTVTFTFDEGALGDLPTHVGFVWTDVGFSSDPAGNGFGTLIVEAYDSADVLIASTLSPTLGDGLFGGQTAEDSFFGVIASEGIARLTITMPASQDWELDHLQFGTLVVSEPGVASLFLVGLTALAFGATRRPRHG